MRTYSVSVGRVVLIDDVEYHTITADDLNKVFSAFGLPASALKDIKTQKIPRRPEDVSVTLTFTIDVKSAGWLIALGVMTYAQYLELLYPQARQYRKN